MINSLPEISISFFSKLASIIYSLGFHDLFVNIISILETKLYQRPVAVMHWSSIYTKHGKSSFLNSWKLVKSHFITAPNVRICYIMGAN